MISFSVLTYFLLINSIFCQNETTIDEDPDATISKDDPRCAPNCFWEYNIVMSDNYKKFPKNCSTVCATRALYVGYETDITEKQMIETFKNMKMLIGSLYLFRSKFKSGIFWAPLETVECDNIGFFKFSLNDKLVEIGMPNLKNVSCRVEISSNKNLTRLNLPLMTQVLSPTANYSGLDLEIQMSGPDFCITTQEMANLIQNRYIKIFGLSGSYCPVQANSSLAGKLCDIRNSTLATMDSGCINVLGDVKILKDTEGSVEKLESVKNIFGNLVIEGTNLTHTDYFDSLENIVSLKGEEQVIRVENNPYLSNVSFPVLKRAYSSIYVPVIFNNNSEELLEDPNICLGIRNSITDTDTWIVKIDDKTCDDIQKDAVVRDKSATGINLSISIVLVITSML